jgi:hypothetical protein
MEHANSGIALWQELRQRRFPVMPVKATDGKIERFEGVTGRIADGDVLIPRQAPFLAAFRQEVMEFPAGRHNDQVDAFSQFLWWSRRPHFVTRVLDSAQNGGRASGFVRPDRALYTPPSLRQHILDSYDPDAPSLPLGGL